MRISFNIHYQTVWGQTLHLVGSLPELGAWNVEQAINMSYTTDGCWSASIEIPDDTRQMTYRYFLQSNGLKIFEEWDRMHTASFDRIASCLLYDTWLNKPEQTLYYTSAFKNILFARFGEKPFVPKDADRKIRLKIFAPNVRRNQHLAVSGNQTVLGNWESGKALKMSCLDFPEWEVEFDAAGLSYPVEYKFIRYSYDQTNVCWEPGENRRLNLPLPKEKETLILSGLFLREDFPNWKGAGTVIPVFSLRSKESFGIGDFRDLKKITDWLILTGQKVLQILPVNDTTMTHTWMDSYPYNAISIYALHPLYLNLPSMGKLKDAALHHILLRVQQELNQQKKVDYEQVDHYKWMFFHAIYAQDGERTIRSRDFRAFFHANEDWLIPYAAYSYLRDLYKTPDFRQWGEYAVYDKLKITALCHPRHKHHREITLYCYLQYHLHRQLKEAKDYAQAGGVILKGDIPIGISNMSIEAWTEPQYFNMEARAGAPPDDFSPTGQNWGFPTYNWTEMEKTDYNWWKKRLRHIACYFDAYRIDHILGFFRIWEVPDHFIQALTGTFNPALPLTPEEISDAGMFFDEMRWTKAQINGRFLLDLFGVYSQEATEKYLLRISPQYFALHPNFDTQVKIDCHFSGKEDFKSRTIKNALFTLANEVLFIPDRTGKNKFHPRILACNTFVYRELSETDRYAFDYIYWDYFYRRHNDFWKEQAYRKLKPIISVTEMLVCGEDLGMIPQSVPEVMDHLHILSLETERMPKQSGVTFGDLSALPYRSVCTTSTHDMSTIRVWWEEDREKTQRYYNEILDRTGAAPQCCPADVCRQIIRNHLNSLAMLVILPLQDWLGMNKQLRRENAAEERINVPSNPRHYWRYRMHLNIEDLLMSKEYNKEVRTLILEARRGEENEQQV